MPSSKPPAPPPWKRPTPKADKPASKLSPAARAAAEACARAAGRRYPNLVDNLWAARQTLDDGVADSDFPPDPVEQTAKLRSASHQAAIRPHTTIEEFVSALDAYIRWYNEARIKVSLGFRSPMEYRRSLAIAA